MIKLLSRKPKLPVNKGVDLEIIRFPCSLHRRPATKRDHSPRRSPSPLSVDSPVCEHRQDIPPKAIRPSGAPSTAACPNLWCKRHVHPPIDINRVAPFGNLIASMNDDEPHTTTTIRTVTAGHTPQYLRPHLAPLNSFHAEIIQPIEPTRPRALQTPRRSSSLSTIRSLLRKR